MTILAAGVVLFNGCEEYQSTGLSSTLAPAGGTATAVAATPPPVEALTKHDVALRFLTAFIRLDRGMALRYATPEAIGKLNWNTSHQGNIPYYDDKMILYFQWRLGTRLLPGHRRHLSHLQLRRAPPLTTAQPNISRAENATPRAAEESPPVAHSNWVVSFSGSIGLRR